MAQREIIELSSDSEDLKPHSKPMSEGSRTISFQKESQAPVYKSAVAQSFSPNLSTDSDDAELQEIDKVALNFRKTREVTQYRKGQTGHNANGATALANFRAPQSLHQDSARSQNDHRVSQRGHKNTASEYNVLSRKEGQYRSRKHLPADNEPFYPLFGAPSFRSTEEKGLSQTPLSSSHQDISHNTAQTLPTNTRNPVGSKSNTNQPNSQSSVHPRTIVPNAPSASHLPQNLQHLGKRKAVDKASSSLNAVKRTKVSEGLSREVYAGESLDGHTVSPRPDGSDAPLVAATTETSPVVKQYENHNALPTRPTSLLSQTNLSRDNDQSHSSLIQPQPIPKSNRGSTIASKFIGLFKPRGGTVATTAATNPHSVSASMPPAARFTERPSNSPSRIANYASAKLSYWPSAKKASIADAVARCLNADPNNLNKYITGHRIRSLMDSGIHFDSICDELRKSGFAVNQRKLTTVFMEIMIGAKKDLERIPGQTTSSSEAEPDSKTDLKTKTDPKTKPNRARSGSGAKPDSISQARRSTTPSSSKIKNQLLQKAQLIQSKLAKVPAPVENTSKDLQMQDVSASATRKEPVATIESESDFLHLPELRPRPHVAKRSPFTPEDDRLLVYLRRETDISWSKTAEFFPGRNWTALQSRYSQKFSPRALALTGKSRTAEDTASRAPSVTSTRMAPRLIRGRTRTEDVSMGNTTEDVDFSIEGPMRRRPARRPELAPSLLRQTSAAAETFPHAASGQENLKEMLRELRQPIWKHSCDRYLRARELGVAGYRTHPRMVHAGIRDYAYSTMGPVRYMDNTSGDVSTVAWSPKGNVFAAGCVAVTDPESWQYNKAVNLVVANAREGEAKELPHHQIPRPIAQKGPNATGAMLRSQDPVLYTTVQSVAFSADGRRMYSVSIDGYLNVYRMRGSNPMKTRLTGRSKHTAPVDLLAVNDTDLVATGCRHSGPNSIHLFQENKDPVGLSPGKITTSSMRKYPTALKFGMNQYHRKYLLAGFSCEAGSVYVEDDSRDKYGETCLWDTTTNQPIELGATNRSVFDLSWNPHASVGSSLFAVASGATGRVNYGMHSVVRLFSPEQNRARAGLELECPAWDINDVIYSPHDENIISAGSTDGKVYIWDTRQVKNDQGPLRILEHGDSLSELPHEKARWEADTGIRFLSWGADRNRLYSGSSDGIIKCWDPYRSDEDKHVRDVANFDSAIMSGAFSPDYDSLLIGEDRCRLNLLSVGNAHKTVKTMEKFVFKDEAKGTETPEPYAASRELLEARKIELRPIGTLPLRQAVQGSNYSGPYSRDPDAKDLREQSLQFQQEAAQRRVDYRSLVAQTDHIRDECRLDCMNFISKEQAEENVAAADYGGRFADRIPESLCSVEQPMGLAAQLLGRNAICHGCGASARSDNNGSGKEAKALCEKCSFSCFRCSQPVRISGRMRVIECLRCDLAWRIGVLGYELIRGDDKVEHGKTVRPTKGTMSSLAGGDGRNEESDIAEEEMARQFDAAAAA